MGNLNVIKPGMWIRDEKFPSFILDARNDQYYRLFNDGSGGWRSEISIKDLNSLTNEKCFSLRIAVKRAYKKNHIKDNLDYIEYLAFIKNYERARKLKKSVPQ